MQETQEGGQSGIPATIGTINIITGFVRIRNIGEDIMRTRDIILLMLLAALIFLPLLAAYELNSGNSSIYLIKVEK